MSWSHAGLASGDRDMPSDYPTEAADGTPHLTYFTEDTSFVWSGSAERPIQVCPGGYGESVTEVIWLEVGGDGSTAEPPAQWLPLHQMLDAFRRRCDMYLREREAR